MKPKTLFLISSLTIILIMLAGCTAGQPQIGILDMERVLNESQRASELKDRLARVGEDLEKNYQEREKELSGENKDNELDDIYMEFLDNKQKLEEQLNKEINSILKEISESENLEIVLYRKYVKYGGQNITDSVINKLDEKYAKGGNNTNGSEE